jgi:hypothetical protein
MPVWTRRARRRPAVVAAAVAVALVAWAAGGAGYRAVATSPGAAQPDKTVAAVPPMPAAGWLAAALPALTPPTPPTTAPPASSASVAPVTPSDPGALAVTTMPLPSGYGRPQFLTADATKPGVWFADATTAGLYLAFWDAAKDVLRQYPLGDPNAHGLGFGDQAGLTVAPDGIVWFGANATLVRLDPSTGAVSYIDVLVVAATNSGDLVRIDPSTGAEWQYRLPTGVCATDVSGGSMPPPLPGTTTTTAAPNRVCGYDTLGYVADPDGNVWLFAGDSGTLQEVAAAELR